MNFYRDIALKRTDDLEVVLENEKVLAFHHTKPSYKVHIVLIPKRHIDSILDYSEADEDVMLELLRCAQTLAAKVVKKTGKCRIVTNAGEYQDTKHLHFHIISD